MTLQLAWRQLFRASWNDFHCRFESILENLRCHKDLVASQATLTHFQASQQARAAAESNIKAMEESIIKQQLISVRDWLCSAKVLNDQVHYAGIRSRDPNYGRWLLGHRAMAAWLDPTSSSITSLWLHGIPGAGISL